MVSLRCKMMVKKELKKLGIHYVIVDLGMVEILEDITAGQRELLAKNLQKSGLELLENKKSILIEKIKNVITEMIHYSDEIPKTNYSDYISEKLGHNYTYLANTFSEVKGMTIQQFIIIHKIERVKELILYDELNLAEISSNPMFPLLKLFNKCAFPAFSAKFKSSLARQAMIFAFLSSEIFIISKVLLFLKSL